MLLHEYEIPSTGTRGKRTVSWARLKCDHCGAEFDMRWGSHGARLKHHFCKKECGRLAKRSGGCLYLVNNPFKLKELNGHGTKKECIQCGGQFTDVTRRQLSKFCSRQCVVVFGVATRHERGTYVRTRQQNARLSAAMHKRHAAGHFTEQGLESLSVALRTRWQSGEMRQKSRATSMARHGTEHWTQTRHARESCVFVSYMRSRSREQALRMQAKRWRTLKARGHVFRCRGRGGRRHDLGDTYFRSRWEANVARVFAHEGWQWEYEPTVFDLPDGRTYTPDFRVLIDGAWTWVEVKGYHDADGMGKWHVFCTLEPNTLLIDYRIYEYYKLHYASIIPTWEH